MTRAIYKQKVSKIIEHQWGDDKKRKAIEIVGGD
jgi:hypothetical protein